MRARTRRALLAGGLRFAEAWFGLDADGRQRPRQRQGAGGDAGTQGHQLDDQLPGPSKLPLQDVHLIPQDRDRGQGRVSLNRRLPRGPGQGSNPPERAQLPKVNAYLKASDCPCPAARWLGQNQASANHETSNVDHGRPDASRLGPRDVLGQTHRCEASPDCQRILEDKQGSKPPEADSAAMRQWLVLTLVAVFALLALLWNGLAVRDLPVLSFFGPFLLFAAGAWLGVEYHKTRQGSSPKGSE